MGVLHCHIMAERPWGHHRWGVDRACATWAWDGAVCGKGWPSQVWLHPCVPVLSLASVCPSVWWVTGQVLGAASLPVLSAAELMERATVPPLWPALYPPGRSSLHHAQQLQLFSQQHFLRQQEFLYLQQQAAQALELQRSAQLVVSPVGPSWGGTAVDPSCRRQGTQVNQQKLHGYGV